MQPRVIEEAPHEPTIFPERQRQEPQRRCRSAHAAAVRAPQRVRPVAAAIANGIFDATGVRIRRVPFSPDRVKGALSS